jgi:hypothetical protein
VFPSVFGTPPHRKSSNTLVVSHGRCCFWAAGHLASKAFAFGGLLGEIFFSVRKSQLFRAMIGLISTVLGTQIIFDHVHAPTFDDVGGPGDSH